MTYAVYSSTIQVSTCVLSSCTVSCLPLPSRPGAWVGTSILRHTIKRTWLVEYNTVRDRVATVNIQSQLSCFHPWTFSTPLHSIHCTGRNPCHNLDLFFHDNFNPSKHITQPCYLIHHVCCSLHRLKACTALTLTSSCSSSPAMTAQHGARPFVLSSMDQVRGKATLYPRHLLDTCREMVRLIDESHALPDCQFPSRLGPQILAIICGTHIFARQ